MTVTIGNASPVGEFLAKCAGSSNTSRTLDEKFLAALKKALAGVGIEDTQVKIEKQSGGPGSERIHLVVEPQTSIQNSAVTGSADPAGEPSATDTFRGPQITRDMWTEELLTGDLKAETLKNVQEPSALMNARLDAVRKPTDAAIQDLTNGVERSVNPSYLATRQQAEAMLDRLRALGLTGGEVEERDPVSGLFAVAYHGESRRYFSIDGMNVGLLVERYAKHTVEVADRMTLAEFSRGTEA